MGRRSWRARRPRCRSIRACSTPISERERMLTIDGLVAGYGLGDILKGVDLRLERGTITCIIGPNGAGKSTVLKAVSGLLTPTLGSISFDGEAIGGLSPRRVLERGIVHVPQERGLFPKMTVFENVLM